MYLLKSFKTTTTDAARKYAIIDLVAYIARAVVAYSKCLCKSGRCNAAPFCGIWESIILLEVTFVVTGKTAMYTLRDQKKNIEDVA